MVKTLFTALHKGLSKFVQKMEALGDVYAAIRKELKELTERENEVNVQATCG